MDRRVASSVSTPARSRGTSNVEFEHVLGRVRGLVILLGDVLTPEEAAEVDELLDHAELGEGLSTLAWLIVEEEKRIPRGAIDEIDSLAARMGIADELPDLLAGHVLDDR